MVLSGKKKKKAKLSFSYLKWRRNIYIFIYKYILYLLSGFPPPFIFLLPLFIQRFLRGCGVCCFRQQWRQCAFSFGWLCYVIITKLCCFFRLDGNWKLSRPTSTRWRYDADTFAICSILLLGMLGGRCWLNSGLDFTAFHDTKIFLEDFLTIFAITHILPWEIFFLTLHGPHYPHIQNEGVLLVQQSANFSVKGRTGFVGRVVSLVATTLCPWGAKAATGNVQTNEHSCISNKTLLTKTGSRLDLAHELLLMNPWSSLSVMIANNVTWKPVA